MTTFEIAKRYMVITATKMAELYEYNWNADFSKKEIENFIGNLQKDSGYEKINPNNLSKNELIELGGALWSDETPGLVLIPLWMRPHLVNEFECASLDGVVKLTESRNIDNDHRFGCLAYGVIVE